MHERESSPLETTPRRSRPVWATGRWLGLVAGTLPSGLEVLGRMGLEALRRGSEHQTSGNAWPPIATAGSRSVYGECTTPIPELSTGPAAQKARHSRPRAVRLTVARGTRGAPARGAATSSIRLLMEIPSGEIGLFGPSRADSALRSPAPREPGRLAEKRRTRTDPTTRHGRGQDHPA